MLYIKARNPKEEKVVIAIIHDGMRESESYYYYRELPGTRESSSRWLLLHLLAFRRSFFRASAFFRQISLPSTVARRQSTPLNTSNMNGVNGINGHSNGHNGLNGYHHEDEEDEPITNGYCNGMINPFF